MKILGLASIVVVATLAFGPPNAGAQTGSSNVMQYKLEADAAFETGCFAMCDCAIVTHPLKGTFKLQHDHFDPLFDYYTVSDVRWVVSDASTYLTITGSGVYKLGGEFALQHELVLDLSIDGAPPKHFDSGLVLGGGKFPTILIDVSLHQNTACVDTLLHVDATDPIATSVEAGPNGAPAPWVKVAPNPFRGATEFRLAMARPSAVDVVICDVRGRAVRHLRSGWLTSGVHTLGWDGQRDQGSACPAGVYFLVAHVGADQMTSRIVKLN
jgi:hypothetical protein